MHMAWELVRIRGVDWRFSRKHDLVNIPWTFYPAFLILLQDPGYLAHLVSSTDNIRIRQHNAGCVRHHSALPDASGAHSPGPYSHGAIVSFTITTTPGVKPPSRLLTYVVMEALTVSCLNCTWFVI